MVTIASRHSVGIIINGYILSQFHFLTAKSMESPDVTQNSERNEHI